MINFGIKIATYKRKKDSTPKMFSKTINSLLKQTHSMWKVFLIGDKYEPQEEFDNLAKLLPKEKIFAINNNFAIEREKYTGHDLWMCGGIESINKIMDIMLEQEIEICATLDDDDIWYEDHLETLNNAYEKFPEASFVHTRGYHVQMGYLPKEEISCFYNNRPPKEHATIHSCTSWNIKNIPLRYINTIESKNPLPGDADLWIRMKDFFKKNNLKFLYVPKVTVWHDEHNPKNKNHSEFLA